ncbi:thioredoxin family protein [uncultured Kordia sp.]|uniref:thioredoxin family protein n=1 Tax=uncultured Kordia sp. TaxID=507699 RepID=UPI00261DBE0B|nr:thioredoxin family protein [uncultured Kordia sp.]
MSKLMYILLLVSTVSFGQEWHANFETAKKEASTKNQHIILVFSGSDWCAPCMKLEREIWDSETFKSYAKANYTLLKADFPRRKKNKLSKELQTQNEQLAEKYNPNGYFPLVVILDETGKQLGQLGYQKIAPEAYIKKLNAF